MIPASTLVDLVWRTDVTNVAERVARGAQLVDLQLQRLALDGEVVEDGAARLVRLLDDRRVPAHARARRSASPFTFAESMSRSAASRESWSIWVGSALGLGDDRGGALLGLDEVRGAALLGLGEDLGAALLRLGGDASGLFVSRSQDRGALGAEGARECRLVKGRVGRAALGLGQLILEFADPGLEVADLARDGLQMEADLVGVEPPLRTVVKFTRAISADDWRVVEMNSAVVHSSKPTGWRAQNGLRRAWSVAWFDPAQSVEVAQRLVERRDRQDRETGLLGRACPRDVDVADRHEEVLRSCAGARRRSSPRRHRRRRRGR